MNVFAMLKVIMAKIANQCKLFFVHFLAIILHYIGVFYRETKNEDGGKMGTKEFEEKMAELGIECFSVSYEGHFKKGKSARQERWTCFLP
jgi:hypothetical protein